MCYLQYPLRNLSNVANTPWNPITNLAENCQYRTLWPPVLNYLRVVNNLRHIQTHLQEGCPSYRQRGNLCAISLRKVKIKAKNQESTHSFKTVRGPYANNVLSIHNTNSPYQSRETVLLNISLRVAISRQIGLVPVPYLPFRLQSLRREMSIKRIYTHSLTAVHHEAVFWEQTVKIVDVTRNVSYETSWETTTTQEAHSAADLQTANIGIKQIPV
jgi:hypothetical protein